MRSLPLRGALFPCSLETLEKMAMSSLEEIDRLFKKAQETIRSGNTEEVRFVL